MNIPPEDIRNKKVAVLGASRSGIAAAKLLLRKGAKVFVSDNHQCNDKEKNCSALVSSGLEYELGGHSERIYEFSDLLVISPGISTDIPVIDEATKLGIPVVSELEVAFWFCRNPIIAVTGTNGKSSTIMMLKSIFDNAGKPSAAAGNIGYAFANIIDEVEKEAIILLEVSSYQLETVKTFHPKVAVILNITPDHLYRHKTMAEYVRCKMRITENQDINDIFVLNAEDKVLSMRADLSKAQVSWFSNASAVKNGTGAVDGMLKLYKDGKENKILSIDSIPVPGAHNVENLAAAATAASFFGVTPEEIKKGIVAYSGLEHRLEVAATCNGVMFINDSKATNLDSLATALAAYDKKVILIAGGQEKGSNYKLLAMPVQESVKTLILFGESSGNMAQAWGDSAEKVFKVESLEEAVKSAFDSASSGDIVLFSPGCPSFDMFVDFVDRGEQFKKFVDALSCN